MFENHENSLPSDMECISQGGELSGTFLDSLSFSYCPVASRDAFPGRYGFPSIFDQGFLSYWGGGGHGSV